jgi:hypothetical protein
MTKLMVKKKILSYHWRWDHTPFQNKDQHANMPTCKQVKQDIFKGQTVLHRTRNTINSICEKTHVLVLCQRNNLCNTNKKQVRNNKKQVRNKWETLRNKETSRKLTLILCFMCFNMIGHSHRSKLHTALAIVRRRPCSVMLCFNEKNYSGSPVWKAAQARKQTAIMCARKSFS